MPDPRIYRLGILTVTVTAAVVTVAARYRRAIRAARKRIAGLGSQLIETDCGPVEYLRMGRGYPVLVIHAADDPIAIAENVRRLADQMPNAWRFVAPAGGQLFFGHRDEAKAEIAQFLRSHIPELQKVPSQ